MSSDQSGADRDSDQSDGDVDQGIPAPEDGPDPWCTWCDVEPEDGRLPFRIEGRDGGRWPPAFCSIECASRWGCAAHQERIYHVERGRELRTDGGVDKSGDGIERRSFAFGSLSALAVVGGLATIGVVTDDPEEETNQPVPSSELISAEASVYDEQASICGIDLVLDVGESERVVIQNEFPGDSDRTVENSGKRLLSTNARPETTILIYAVDLNANTSKILKTYRISEECSLSEVDHAA